MILSIVSLTVSIITLALSIATFIRTRYILRLAQADREVIEAIQNGATLGQCDDIYIRHNLLGHSDRLLFYWNVYRPVGGIRRVGAGKVNDLIVHCVDSDGCRAMEAEIKRRGLWKAYRKALTGNDDDIGVPEANHVLWGWSWDQRRVAARQALDMVETLVIDKRADHEPPRR